MTNLFLFTASNKVAQEYWSKSILNSVPSAIITSHLSKEFRMELLNLLLRNVGLYCWGATPSKQNILNWERMEVDDWVMGIYKDHYKCVASVVAKYHNPTFANELWGRDDEGKTLEYIYFLKKPGTINLHKNYLQDFLGDAPENFRRISDERILKIKKDYGSIKRFLQQKVNESIGNLSLPYLEEIDPIDVSKLDVIQKQNQLSAISTELSEGGGFDSLNVEDARLKMLKAVVLRRGQNKFRENLLWAYKERCAVTGSDCDDALEAAHILSYKGEHTNHVSNGLLLRSDIHTLFDLGLFAIDATTMKVVLNNKLKSTSYGFLEGKKVYLPLFERDQPNKEALTEHRASAGL